MAFILEVVVKSIWVIPALVLVTGCFPPDPYPAGSMLPGKIICLADGKTLPMEIELTPLSSPSGKMTAVDPVTQERFAGTYTCMVETKTVNDAVPNFWGAQQVKTSVQMSNVVPGMAVLVGDKGTVLNIRMSIQAGRPPVGFGSAEDNKNNKYTLQF